jgi:hypothetical protein
VQMQKVQRLLVRFARRDFEHGWCDTSSTFTTALSVGSPRSSLHFAVACFRIPSFAACALLRTKGVEGLFDENAAKDQEGIDLVLRPPVCSWVPHHAIGNARLVPSQVIGQETLSLLEFPLRIPFLFRRDGPSTFFARGRLLDGPQHKIGHFGLVCRGINTRRLVGELGFHEWFARRHRGRRAVQTVAAKRSPSVKGE